MLTRQPCVHLAVATRGAAHEPRQLALPGLANPTARSCRIDRGWIAQLPLRRSLDVDQQIHPVEQRTAQPPPMAPEFSFPHRQRSPTPANPHGHGLVAATSMNLVGNTSARWARTIVTHPSSSGCRSASRLER